jgi:hypothetical protein
MLLEQLSAPTEQHNALTAMLTHKNAFCLIKDNIFESVDVKSKVFWWGWTLDMHADTDLLRNAEYEDRRQVSKAICKVVLNERTIQPEPPGHDLLRMVQAQSLPLPGTT